MLLFEETREEEFQIVGPETQNALSPNLVFVLGTMKSVMSAEHRSDRLVVCHVHQLCQFELDAITYWQPVQFHKARADVVTW